MGSARFRILEHGSGSAAWNMSVDEALLLEAASAGPALRFYAWQRPALSLGYRQVAPDWLGRCEALGIEPVRRVTGGGAVLHAGDLTYAVVAPIESRQLPADLAGSYEWIRTRLLEGLRAAGFAARAARARADAPRLELCFAGATGYEVELDGRKLIGSAQRRTRHALLQHGSIRIADDSGLYRALTGATPAPPPPPGIDAERLRRAIRESFAAALAAPLELAELSPAERGLAEARVTQRDRDRLAAPGLSLRRFPQAADRVA